MKISHAWLQNFFTSPLPSPQEVGEALTFHAFEIESVVDDVLDVKVTANRGHDCLSHRGIAKELSAILKLPLNPEKDPFAKAPDLSKKTGAVSVTLEDPRCKRYVAGYIRNVKVGPSPDWLRNSLEVIGQRSINNVVDATNLVMFNTGQPLHAFDAGKLSENEGRYAIAVRGAKKGERMIALDEKEYTFAGGELLIIDAHNDTPIGIAGVKGGAPAAINEETADIIIESANFDGVSVRKTSQSLKLRTDASQRFEQVITPELAAYGMQQVVDMILALAGGELQGFVDEYPSPMVQQKVAVSAEKVNAVLGTELSEKEIEDAFTRLGFAFESEGDVFIVTPPFERLDILIPEDLIEEVGRIIGYDAVPAEELPEMSEKPAVNANFAAAEAKREELMKEGYSEVYTSVFAEKGDRVVANKVDGVRPFLRTSLVEGLQGAYERNIRNKDLLGLKEVKLFEIGTVWRKGKEDIVVGIADKEGVREEVLAAVSKEEYGKLASSRTERYTPFSKYPFIVRDIALWVPSGTSEDEVLSAILSGAGELVVRSELFDTFEKAGRMSYAFRLVFQSFDKTLTDEEVNARMESVYALVKEKDWEVR